MARYIDADRLIFADGGNDNRNFDFVLRMQIDNAESVDAVPVMHGHWEKPHWENSDYCCSCSVCHGRAMYPQYKWHENGIYKYCPNCGTKMDVEDKP